jgi:LysM repeat protein
LGVCSRSGGWRPRLLTNAPPGLCDAHLRGYAMPTSSSVARSQTSFRPAQTVMRPRAGLSEFDLEMRYRRCIFRVFAEAEQASRRRRQRHTEFGSTGTRQGGLEVQRRRKRRSRLVVLLPIVVVAAGAGWWFWPRGAGGPSGQLRSTTENPRLAETGELADAGVPEAVIAATDEGPATDEVLTPVAAGGEAVTEPDGTVPEPVQASALDDEHRAASEGDAAEKLSDNPRINASLQRYQAGQVIAARQELNRMLAISRNESERAELRRHLRKIADETVFSKQQRPDDPLFETYTVQPGEYLINIGKRFEVPHEAIMLINGITDPTRIRPGQKIKVPRGPFNVKIHQTQFRLDVYLQDLYLRSFPVGLGTDQGTPLGEWLVKERLPNPAYYPPAAAEVKRIIPPDDPTNPLGEHWIGLEGVGGDAVGRVGYGIHGTIEPETIGQAVSLGCVRMHNQDVAFLYQLMMPGCSKVTTLP